MDEDHVPFVWDFDSRRGVLQDTLKKVVDPLKPLLLGLLVVWRVLKLCQSLDEPEAAEIVACLLGVSYLPDRWNKVDLGWGVVVKG
jgi:hypothetical protein